MSDVISEYQRWKEQGEALRAQARQAIETRFRDLLTEAARLAEEYRADFGAPLKPPPVVTAFRYKAGGKPKTKKVPAKKEVASPPAPPAKADPKVAALQKKLENARKKLETAKAGGGPTRAIEDRIYELEDELRLATSAG
jgi:hypothetical protein